MRELSLYILDIAQNSLSAGAKHIDISVEENTTADTILICITDNGHGMAPQQVLQVTNPFYTTRTTRRVGMGISLFRLAAEQSGGSLEISSIPEQGTTLTAMFVRSHIDRPPIGDMEGTITALIRLNPKIDFCYKRSIDERSFSVDTTQLRKILGEVTLDTPEVVSWISEYIQEQNSLLSGACAPD
ncbi:MAG: ATP-binding protein [Oscillospiraceae bacterium]|nr:ATP-binding protein [Oscillospiraceae bacterium]MDD4545745.1 ATP-binding protein [Oscillospiraceae bacterium]